MTTSHQSSAALAARQALADRLRELRLDAGLSGRDVAAHTGWQPSKVSRLETGRTLPADADIRMWCAACHAEDLADDLIAAGRTAASMYMEWRRLQRGGLRRVQEDRVPLYARTRTFRVYSSSVVPGMVQTREYATALLRAFGRFHSSPGDVEDAADARMRRSRGVLEGPHRVVLLLEEAVLRHTVGGGAAMAGQLGHLLSVMALPVVSIGVIPAGTDREEMWTTETFTLFDAECAAVELLTAAVTITVPSEIEQYERAFNAFADQAVYGTAARKLITDAIQALP